MNLDLIFYEIALCIVAIGLPVCFWLLSKWHDKSINPKINKDDKKK